MARRRAWGGVLRSVLVVVAGVLLLEGAYLLFAATLLPRDIQEASRRAGLEVTFASSRSYYPGRIHFEALRVVRPGAWSVEAERLHLALDASALVWGELRAQRARAVGLKWNWNGNHVGPLEARWELGDAAAEHGWATIDGERARLVIGAWSGQLDVEGRVQLQPQAGSEHGFLLNDAKITASATDLRRAPANLDEKTAKSGSPSLRMSLRSPAAAYSRGQGFSLRGRLAVSGDDAGIWLDLANASSTVRWMLAELVGTPFELEAAVRMQRGGVAVEQLRLEAGMNGARGDLYCEEQECRGAFLVRRGAGSIGISISSTGVTARLMPEPEWLSLELERSGEWFQRSD